MILRSMRLDVCTSYDEKGNVFPGCKKSGCPGFPVPYSGPWGAMEQWMQLRFIVRGIGHRAATILTSSTATLFVLFAAATGTELVSTRFGCLQPDCLPA